jgi:pimeloyl-ACP methyl ester carboxylesterase/DNA-binding CsgD family transcriptional regulator
VTRELLSDRSGAVYDRSMPGAQPPQTIRFCRAPDGVRIAYAVHGSGPPLLVSTCWLSQLQYDWESPVWRHFLRDLGRFATVIRYDERGHGLSDWEVDDHSLAARIGDLEAVADDAGFDRFALMAMSQGGPPAIEYAVRHHERVTRLLFYGSSAALLHDPTPQELELFDVFDQMVRVGYGRVDSVFRRVFTSLMIPGATEEQMRWLDDLQAVATSAENAYAARLGRAYADTRHLLPGLDLPTLVLHSRGDQVTAFKKGRYLAATIPGARFVTLESNNHIVLGDEVAWPVFVREVEAFLAPDRTTAPATGSATGSADALSPREREVLTLAATGIGNDEIAGALHLSVRTVERHLHNSYAKLGVSGRSARTAAVSRLLASR